MESLVTPSSSEDSHQCSKRFWSFVKKCGQEDSGIAKLVDQNGEVKHSATEKAEVLNAQFQSVFSKPTPVPLNVLCEDAVRSPDVMMPQIQFTVAGIDKLLVELNPHKAAGPDGVKPLILKNLHMVIAPTLQIIFQKAYDSHRTPDEWRKACITPIYKKGSKEDPANYRPVSLTCVVSKVMEHIIVSSMMRHLEGNNLLHDNQHGFRRNRSCDTQLLDFTHNLMTSMQAGNQTDIIVMDFAKAFDSVPHTHLLFKLRRLGVDPDTVEWIKSFLQGRSQRVLLEGASSSEVPVLSGVPQGSVIGPVLFLVYINDLSQGLTSDIRLFADDTVLSREVKTQDDAIALQQDLHKLEVWSNRWSLKFHPKKCQVMRVTRARTTITHRYTLFDTELQQSDQVKYLGVNFSSDMKWNAHIDAVKSKANSKLGFLRRNVRIASTRLKSQLYTTVVRSNLEYASTVWSPHEAKLTNSLEATQRRAARWVLQRYDRRASVSQMLTELGWLTLAQRRLHSRLVMLYRISHGLACVPHSFLSHPPNTRHSRYNHTHTYALLPARTNYYKYSFFPSTVSHWNALPLDTIEAPSVESFKARLQAAATRTV